MHRTFAAAALIALLVVAAPASAKPRTLHYSGKTDDGNSISFDLKGNRISRIGGYVTTTCVPDHGTAAHEPGGVQPARIVRSGPHAQDERDALRLVLGRHPVQLQGQQPQARSHLAGQAPRELLVRPVHAAGRRPGGPDAVHLPGRRRLQLQEVAARARSSPVRGSTATGRIGLKRFAVPECLA